MRLPRRHMPFLASAAALVLLYAAACVRYAESGFFSAQVFVNLLVDNSFLGIAAVGMTFVILSGGIDLSVGAVMSCSSVLLATFVGERDWPPAVAIAAVLSFGAVFGAGMGGLIHVTGLRPFIVTLAGMFLVRGLGYLVHLESIGMTDPWHASVASFALQLGSETYLPFAAIALLIVVAGAAYVLKYSAFGRSVYALGGSEEAARLMGLAVGRTRVLTYAVSGLCSATAGVVLTFYLSSGSHIEGIGLELDAIAAVVVGGTLLSGGSGSVVGTLSGLLLIGLIRSSVMTYETGLSSGLTKVVTGALLLVFVIFHRVLTQADPRSARGD